MSRESLEKLYGEIRCPVCGQGTIKGYSGVCPVCGWVRDTYQEANPDEDCCENQCSLNEARAAWARGEKFL